MTGSDDEFEDFLRRRSPPFRRAPDEVLEPPAELDRIVLRQARAAIEAERPQRVYQGPRWGAPLALAATLLIAFTVILQVGTPKKTPLPEVTVQTVAQRLDSAAATPPTATPMAEAPYAAPAAPAAAADDPVVVGLAEPRLAKRDVASPAPAALQSQAEADRYAPMPPPPPAESSARSAGNSAQAGVMVADTLTDSRTEAASAPPGEAQKAMAKASSGPAWRHDSKTWLAEIERLRAAGKAAEADAELAEFKRQHRAYAASPDK